MTMLMPFSDLPLGVGAFDVPLKGAIGDYCSRGNSLIAHGIEPREENMAPRRRGWATHLELSL